MCFSSFLKLALCFYSLFLLSHVHCANILFYHSMGSYSHRVATYPLADALAKRGHQVTFLSPHRHRGPYINPNISEIVPKVLEKTVQNDLEVDFIYARIHNQMKKIAHNFYPRAVKFCEDLLCSPEFQQYFNNTLKLDLVIIDNFARDCCVAIAYKYRAKHIFFNTVIHVPNEFDLYGIPSESSSIPEKLIDPPQTPMSFMERVSNTLSSILFRWAHYTYVKDVDRVVRKYLGLESMPFLDEVARNMSLVFYPGDVLSDYPRSHPPLVVNVGGMNCHEFPTHATINQDVLKFIEHKNDTTTSQATNDGFIYISLGSISPPSKLPEKILKMFFSMMRGFPQLKFLWKWDSANFPRNAPKNLYLNQWFPQKELLAHPKIRGFIMQGGRPSTVESLCNAVPMTALPVLGDQDVNAMRMNRIGGNILLEWGTLTQEQLEDAVWQMAYDSGMKAQMIKLQQVLLDRPISALDTAVWWTEYVLRHKDTTHLRAAGFDQWWFQRRLMDVWAFIFLTITVVLIVLFSILSACSKYLKTRLSLRIWQTPASESTVVNYFRQNNVETLKKKE